MSYYKYNVILAEGSFDDGKDKLFLHWTLHRSLNIVFNQAFNSKIGKAGLYPTFLSFLSFPDILQLRNSATFKLCSVQYFCNS